MCRLKTFEYYMTLPYRIVLIQADEGGYVAEIPELPGCITQGDDLEDALKMVEDAKAAWIDISLQDGNEIPEPSSIENYTLVLEKAEDNWSVYAPDLPGCVATGNTRKEAAANMLKAIKMHLEE